MPVAVLTQAQQTCAHRSPREVSVIGELACRWCPDCTRTWWEHDGHVVPLQLALDALRCRFDSLERSNPLHRIAPTIGDRVRALLEVNGSPTPSEVAGAFGVTPRAVLNWVEGGHIEADRLPGKHMRIRPLSLLALLKKMEESDN